MALCYSQENQFVFFRSNDVTFKTLEPSVYRGISTQTMDLLEKVELKSDNLLDLPDSTSVKLLNEIEEFYSLSTKKRYDKFGLLYKRGILLYGKPGTGKTCLINKITKLVSQKDVVCLIDTAPATLKKIVNQIRAIEPNKKILVIYEEFDGWYDNDESGFLSLLDGDGQLDNIVYLATTNYIEQLPPRIINRPSRFASIIEIGFPSAEVRRSFFVQKLHDMDVNIEELVNDTDGLTIDHLKDLIISAFCLNVPLTEAINKLRQLDGEDLADVKQSEDIEGDVFYGPHKKRGYNKLMR